MELGSNSPFIVMPDADIDKVVGATITSGYANAGQVCISAQRIITSRELYADYLDALTAGVQAISTGDPLDESVRMGPMIREQDADRVDEVDTGGGVRRGQDGRRWRPAGRHVRPHGRRRRQAGDARLVRGAVRAGGRGHTPSPTWTRR